MDALQLLTDDHQEVLALLADIAGTTAAAEDARRRLIAAVRGRVAVHEILEEEILYPALEVYPDAREAVIEAYEAQRVVHMLLNDVLSLPVTHPSWRARCEVMRRNVEHHVGEAEADIFKRARRLWRRDELAALGARMLDRRVEAIGRLAPARLPA